MHTDKSYCDLPLCDINKLACHKISNASALSNSNWKTAHSKYRHSILSQLFNSPLLYFFHDGLHWDGAILIGPFFHIRNSLRSRH